MDTSNHTTKRCTKCGNEYPATTEHFYVDKRRNQLFAACKRCHLDRGKQWRDANIEHARATNNRNYEANKAELREKHRQYQRDHKEEAAERRRRWAQQNPERARAHSLKWREKNIDAVRLKDRNWTRDNPEKNRAKSHIRRARVLNAGGSHTAHDVELQFKMQNGICWWCDKPVGDDYHVDHRIPLTRGGSNAAENICISCPTCNLSKKNKLPQEWNGRLL
jgi:5-methylcytosine-specific restriction endonuclease McrA